MQLDISNRTAVISSFGNQIYLHLKARL
ncbi:hypothetical protein QQP08_016571 [Theobroma cacao]|nr:hypothetical protein QQP08_016571 [Theobroma cacao]